MGFGSATVLTPVATFMMDIKAAILVVAFFHLFGNASKVGVFLKHVDWPLFFRFGTASVLFTVGGAILNNYVATPYLKGVFGVFLVLFVIISLIHPTFGLKPSLKTSILGGASSGFVAGLIGTGGAIRGAFLTAFHLSKERYIATSAMIAVVIDATRIPVYLQGGALKDFSHPLLIPLLFIVAYLGTKVGKKIVGKVSTQMFRKIVMTLLFLAGLKFILEGFKI